MQLATLTEFYLRDIAKLKEEISLYKNEIDLWMLKNDVKNSAGTLALHLIGNLKFFIGAQLGKTGYVRNRDKEFAERNVPKATLLKELDKTSVIVKKALSNLKEEDLNKEYPIEFSGAKRTIGYMLILFSTHLNYHLGQMNYHRRLLA